MDINNLEMLRRYYWTQTSLFFAGTSSVSERVRILRQLAKFRHTSRKRTFFVCAESD